jgi:hypothetical protein
LSILKIDPPVCMSFRPSSASSWEDGSKSHLCHWVMNLCNYIRTYVLSHCMCIICSSGYSSTK